MDLIYDSLDRYREALMFTNCFKENANADIELEAICCSKLGKIFHKIMKDETKAHLYVKQSIELGLTMRPKNVATEKWYKEAAEILQLIRKSKEKEENKVITEEINKIKKDNELVFTKIDKESKKGYIEFMKFAIKTHPPQPESVLNVDVDKDAIGIKKLLLKAVSMYHPDKFMSTDMLKKVTMEEICKHLTSFYEQFK